MQVSDLATKVFYFWEWFLVTEAQIWRYFAEEDSEEGDYLIDAINEKVLDFGAFSWQIGEGTDKPFYFLISPNGRADGLAITRVIMGGAPELNRWEFHHAKPAKDWDFQLTIYDDYLRIHQIDASGWEVVLLEGASGRFKILFEAGNTHHLDQDGRQAAGGLAVINLLGEEVMIEQVEDMEVWPELPEARREEAFPIRELRERFF